ncbi:MAG: hypothetical protein NTU41_15280 [Chloroflexi bacterium]|nr:hypothetical protein [Chloroflexota bacterium]
MKLCRNLAAALWLLSLFGILCLPQVASAQGTLTVWPVKLEVTANTGEILEREINVQNEGDETIAVRVYTMDFSVDADGKYTFSEPGDESYSCARWITAGPADFELGASEDKKVLVSITVPATVEPGEHRAAILVEESTPADQPGVSVAVSGRIASLVYVAMPGTDGEAIVASAEIVSLMLPRWVEKGPAQVGVVIRNTGNVHLTVATEAHFHDYRGRRFGDMTLEQVVILPGQERTVRGTLERTPLLGKVQADFTIGYIDQHTQLVNKSGTGGFAVVPVRLILAFVVPLGCLLAYLLIRRYRSARKRRNPLGSSSQTGV